MNYWFSLTKIEHLNALEVAASHKIELFLTLLYPQRCLPVMSPQITISHWKWITSSCFVTPDRCQCEHTLRSQLACWVALGNARDCRVFSDSGCIKHMLLYISECVCACAFTCESIKGKPQPQSIRTDTLQSLASLFYQPIFLLSTPPFSALHADLHFLLSALLILFVLSFLLRIWVFWKRQLVEYAPLIPYPQSNLPTDHWTLSLSVCVKMVFAW